MQLFYQRYIARAVFPPLRPSETARPVARNEAHPAGPLFFLDALFIHLSRLLFAT